MTFAPAPVEITDSSSVSLPIVISIVSAFVAALSMVSTWGAKATIRVLSIGIETAKQQADTALAKYAESVRENARIHADMTERIHALETAAATSAQSGAQTAAAVQEIRGTMVSREFLNSRLDTQTAEIAREFGAQARHISNPALPTAPRLDPRRERP
jgi:hypothetical protein